MPNSDGNQGFDPSDVPVDKSKLTPQDETAEKLHDIKDDVIKKRKRPRRRRKKIDHETVKAEVFAPTPERSDVSVEPEAVAEAEVIPVNPFSGQEEIIEAQEPDASATDVHPFDGGVSQEELAASLDTQPVNPFAESSLPPKEHESLKRDEEREKVEMEPVDEGDQIDPFGAQLPQSEAIEPVNPFDPVPSSTPPLEDRALGFKPLDRAQNYDMEPEVEDETLSSEEMGHSDEQLDDSSEIGVSSPPVENSFVDESEPDYDAVREAEPAEVISVESVPISGEPAVGIDVNNKDKEVEEFKNDFWNILSQAGIGKSHLIGLIIAVFVVVGVILFFLFGGLDFFKSDPSSVSSSDVVSENVVEGEVSDSEAYGVISSYIVGLEHTEVVTPIEASPVGEWGDIAGVDTALIVGSGGITQEVRYQYYITLLRTAQNIYSVDVYVLVDLATDRRAALDAHLAQMNTIIADLERALAEINQIMGQLDAQFELVVADREFYEQQYFATTEELLSESSYNNLMEFVRTTELSDQLKAYYNGYKFVKDMYVNSLNAIKPRYQDIFLNRDAVVQGVRIFDIPSSEIDAIIRLNN